MIAPYLTWPLQLRKLHHDRLVDRHSPRMAERGKATQLKKGGYPTRYVAFARDVLPLIANGPPQHDDMDIIGDDHVMPNGRSGNVILRHEKIAVCPPEQILTIDAWDLD